MSTLPPPLRRQLENAIKRARKIAEGGARKGLEALAVHEPDAYGYMDEARQDLRHRLRAQAKQLGDGESLSRSGAYEIGHLVEKLAYDQWHRLLFARFLIENNLLISPEHEVALTLDDCEELASALGLRDAWAVAARFAAKELPEIFRVDDPTGAVEMPVEDRNQLIQLVVGCPLEVFTASDSLGWCYQFWQAERKKEVNDAGIKIGADELPAVTQFFTEDFMVDSLLDNTLGAWHAGKVLAAKPTTAESMPSEEEVRTSVALPGCRWQYLRLVETPGGKWAPAAGTSDAWPKHAKDLKCLDPCMGSGHFIVAMFERLVALRMVEEELGEAAAVAVVIRDNLYGLEIDPRCTQIAAFNLALAAWRRVGYCTLPMMNLACSGLSPNASEGDWLAMAGNDDKLRNGMQRLYKLFQEAPVLGSLIDPRAVGGDLLAAGFHELQPLLEEVLARESANDAAHEMAVAARGIAKAADILAIQFTLVATNVPYLGRGKQDDVLKGYCQRVYPDSKADLSTCFVERCLDLCGKGASTALVTPQNWWFLGSYKTIRKKLLIRWTVDFIVTLGEEAWQSFGDRGPVATLMITRNISPASEHSMAALDALPKRTIREKAGELRLGALRLLTQTGQYENPDHRILVDAPISGPLLRDYADSFQGVSPADFPHFGRRFWEVKVGEEWRFWQSTVEETMPYGGRSLVLWWNGDLMQAVDDGRAFLRGQKAWGKTGVACGQMRKFSCTIYTGEVFNTNAAVIVPSQPAELPALWAYCSSSGFRRDIRHLDKAVKVTNASFVKVPFDLIHWRSVAAEKYPNGLPTPFSSDPTQWLFCGHPKNSDQPLQVAVARLLGYQWPRQTGSSFWDCPALGSDGLGDLVDDDGIVCLSAIAGETPAAEKLRRLLVRALDEFDLVALIAGSGTKVSRCSTLEDWLQNEFFEQHSALFSNHPFIWQIWDRQKGGFSALVNYHKLTHGNLEKLIYVYLGDWIRRQQAAVEAGEAGSDARFQAAKQLQARLKLILEGEPPYDIFVRWKPLSKQAIGWHPDLNDGVRLNIRPFVIADILRKPVKINLKKKDDGKESLKAKDEFPWFWNWDGETEDFAGVGTEPDGKRWNDCHYTNEFKRKARERASRNE